MKLVKVSETPTTITLGWDPVPGADGYLFYKDGVRVSKTFDPNRRTVQFSKPGTYRVEAVAYNVIGIGNYPPPPPRNLAPQTYNRGSSGQDARYCTRESGNPDGGGFHYDADGRSLGGRSGNPVAGLKPADQMDGREPCDPYTNGNLSFPPWPAASYDV